MRERSVFQPNPNLDNCRPDFINGNAPGSDSFAEFRGLAPSGWLMLSMAESPPIVEATKLTRKSRDGAVLIDGVSLSIRAEERRAIAGPTGSGKTVLLRALALLDPIDGGEVLWKGNPIADADVPAYRRDVVYLQQQPALVEGTVEDNLRLPFEFAVNRDRSFDRDRCCESLKAFDLDADFLSKPSSDLSGGESQITAMIRAVQLEPSLLLLDEPTASLDAGSAQLVERFLGAWFDDAPGTRAVVWVTHDDEQRERVADSITRLRSGRIVE